MEWPIVEQDDAVIARPAGRIDETNWETFTQWLVAAVGQAKAGRRTLVIDLAGLDYMSSRGLRALTVARKEAGEATAITLAAPNARMREILAISRYDKLFRIVPDPGAPPAPGAPPGRGAPPVPPPIAGSPAR